MAPRKPKMAQEPKLKPKPRPRGMGGAPSIDKQYMNEQVPDKRSGKPSSNTSTSKYQLKPKPRTGDMGEAL